MSRIASYRAYMTSPSFPFFFFFKEKPEHVFTWNVFNLGVCDFSDTSVLLVFEQWIIWEGDAY